MALCFKITSMRFKEREVTSGTSAVTSLAVEAPLCTLVWKCSAGHWNRIPSTPGRRAPFEPLGLRLSTLSQGRSANPRFSSGCLWGPDSLFTLLQLRPSLSASLTPRRVSRHWYGAGSTNLLLNSAVQEPHRSRCVPDCELSSEGTEDSSQQMSRQQFSPLVYADAELLRVH